MRGQWPEQCQYPLSLKLGLNGAYPTLLLSQCTFIIQGRGRKNKSSRRLKHSFHLASTITWKCNWWRYGEFLSWRKRAAGKPLPPSSALAAPFRCDGQDSFLVCKTGPPWQQACYLKLKSHRLLPPWRGTDLWKPKDGAQGSSHTIGNPKGPFDVSWGSPKPS